MINKENNEELKQMLMCDEGVAFKPYRCTNGKLTIGVGRNIEDRGLLSSEIKFLLQNDIYITYGELNEKLVWFSELSWPRKAALVNMCFQLGMPSFRSFKRMLAACAHCDWGLAAKEMLDSKYAQEDTPERAKRNAYILEHNEIPKDWYREYQKIT